MEKKELSEEMFKDEDELDRLSDYRPTDVSPATRTRSIDNTIEHHEILLDDISTTLYKDRDELDSIIKQFGIRNGFNLKFTTREIKLKIGDVKVSRLICISKECEFF